MILVGVKGWQAKKDLIHLCYEINYICFFAHMPAQVPAIGFHPLWKELLLENWQLLRVGLAIMLH